MRNGKSAKQSGKEIIKQNIVTEYLTLISARFISFGLETGRNRFDSCDDVDCEISIVEVG